MESTSLALSHAQPAKRRKFSTSYCPHCKRSVSKSTWYRHYAEFYNVASGLWEDSKPGGSDFNFSSSGSSGDEDTCVPMDQFPFADEEEDDYSDDEDTAANVSEIYTTYIYT